MGEKLNRNVSRASSSVLIAIVMMILVEYCEAAMFEQLKTYSTTNTSSKLISSYSNGNSVLNMADENSTYCLASNRKVTFGIPTTKIIAKQDSVKVVYSAASSLNNYTFMVSDTYSYTELSPITAMDTFKYFFGNYLVYTTTDSSNHYSVYNIAKKTIGRLDVSGVANFASHVCSEAMENFIFCIKPGSTSGYVLDLVELKATSQEFTLKIGNDPVNYQAIHQVHGYERVVIIVGERSVASVFVVTVDAYYITDSKTLTLISSIKSGTDANSLACTLAPSKRIVFNPIMGFMIRYCLAEAQAPKLFGSTESIFVESSETFWATTDKIEAIHTNKYQGTFTLQYTGAAAKGVNLFKFNETTTPSIPNDCLTYSRVFKLCIRCNPGYLLVKSDSGLNCELNQTYIDSSLYSIELTKGYLLLHLNGSNFSGSQLTDKLTKQQTFNESKNLEFYTQTGQRIDPNPFFTLKLMMEPSDQERKIIRYKIVHTTSNERMVLKVKFKLSSPSLVFVQQIQSARLLQATGTIKELVFPAHAYSSFDTDTFFLCLYLILAFSAQIFLIFVRPFKDSLRDTIKTFWVSSAVMHIQVLCLLGTIGGQFRGPMNRVLRSCLRSMQVYLVFNAEVDFDGKMKESIFKSPYEDFKYSESSPFILQSRYIWIILYAVAFGVSTIGTKNFRNIVYHIRVGVLWSWAIQLLYFSLSTIYSFSVIELYTPVTTFSLVLAIACLIFLIGEIIFAKMSNYNNRKFMLSFDCSRNVIDGFIMETGCLLRTYHDLIFCLGSAFLMAVIPNRVEILCRALMGLAIIYILSVISQIRLYRSDPYIICYYGKLVWAGLFIMLMILLVELDKNSGLGIIGIEALSYLALVIYIGCYLIVFAVMIYRWFAKEKEGASSKPEISYKTSYAIKRYDQKRSDTKEGTRNTYKPNGNESSIISRDFRTDRKQSVLESLQAGSPAREQRSFLKSPMGSDSKYKSFRLSELNNLQKNDSGSSRPNSDRNTANTGQSKLLDRFTVTEEQSEKDKSAQRIANERKGHNGAGQNTKSLGRLGKIDDPNNENKESMATKNLYQIKESRIEEASQLGDISSDINLEINGEQTTGLKDLMAMSDRRVVRSGLQSGEIYGKPDDLEFNSQVNLRPPLAPKRVDDDEPEMKMPSEADD